MFCFVINNLCSFCLHLSLLLILFIDVIQKRTCFASHSSGRRAKSKKRASSKLTSASFTLTARESDIEDDLNKLQTLTSGAPEIAPLDASVESVQALVSQERVFVCCLLLKWVKLLK